MEDTTTTQMFFLVLLAIVRRAVRVSQHIMRLMGTQGILGALGSSSSIIHSVAYICERKAQYMQRREAPVRFSYTVCLDGCAYNSMVSITDDGVSEGGTSDITVFEEI